MAAFQALSVCENKKLLQVSKRYRWCKWSCVTKNELKEEHWPICIDISPIAHVALLHTDINSGFKLVPSMGMKSAERGKLNNLATGQRLAARKCFTNEQTERTDAWFDMLEASLGEIPEQSKRTLTHLWHLVLRGLGGKSKTVSHSCQFASFSCDSLLQLFTCMHWYMRVRMLLRATSCSIVPPKPSARPLRRSKATIMKSLSGASYWSGWDWCSYRNKNREERKLVINEWNHNENLLAYNDPYFQPLQKHYNLKFQKLGLGRGDSSLRGLDESNMEHRKFIKTLAAGLNSTTFSSVFPKQKRRWFTSEERPQGWWPSRYRSLGGECVKIPGCSEFKQTGKLSEGPNSSPSAENSNVPFALD